MGGAASQAGDAQRNNHSPSNGLHSFVFGQILLGFEFKLQFCFSAKNYGPPASGIRFLSTKSGPGRNPGHPQNLRFQHGPLKMFPLLNEMA
jgi:hypothetical protein